MPRALAGEEWLGLRPFPVDCHLPHTGQEARIDVWGYAACSLGLASGSTVVTCAEVMVDERATERDHPPLEEAAAHPGTVFTSRPIPNAASVVSEFLRGDRQAQPLALDPSLIAETQYRAVNRRIADLPVPRYARIFPRSKPVGGRLIVVNDPRMAAHSGFEDAGATLKIPNGGLLRVDVGLKALQRSGTDAGLIAMTVRPETSLDDAAMKAVTGIGRDVLASVVAHLWLLGRARGINHDIGNVVDELLQGRSTLSRLHELQLRAAALRVAFLEGVELRWSLSGQAQANGLMSTAGALARLSHGWDLERRHFDGLWIAASTATVPRPPRAQEPESLQERIRGFREESNPFIQMAMFQTYVWPRIEARLADRGTQTRMLGGRALYRRLGTVGTSANAWLDRRIERHQTRREHSALDRKVPTREPNTKDIEIHPFRNRWALFEELGASIAFTTFMTTTSVVFLGLVLQPSEDADSLGGLELDVLFLFVASFGFFFSTLLYSNASGELARHGTLRFEGLIESANRVSEYLGVYPLLLALPLTVSRYLGDGLVPVVVCALAWISMLGYHYGREWSLLERDISDDTIGSNLWRRRVFIPALLLPMGLAFVGALTNVEAIAKTGAFAFGTLMLVLLGLSALVPERENQSKYTVHAWDILGEETPSHFSDAAEKGRPETV